MAGAGVAESVLAVSATIRAAALRPAGDAARSIARVVTVTALHTSRRTATLIAPFTALIRIARSESVSPCAPARLSAPPVVAARGGTTTRPIAVGCAFASCRVRVLRGGSAASAVVVAPSVVTGRKAPSARRCPILRHRTSRATTLRSTIAVDEPLPRPFRAAATLVLFRHGLFLSGDSR